MPCVPCSKTFIMQTPKNKDLGINNTVPKFALSAQNVNSSNVRKEKKHILSSVILRVTVLCNISHC